MVKFYFHKKTDLKIHGEKCTAIFCDCLYYHEENEYYYRLFFGNYDDNCLVAKFKIKSIEFIQPTEL